MNYKKNSILSAICCCLVVLFAAACKDEALNFEDSTFSSVMYLGNVGENKIDFYNVNSDITYATFIGKGGTSKDIAREAKLKIWTSDELDTYNKSTGTNYRLLPKEYYSLEEDYTFSGTEERKQVEIILKKAIGSLDRTLEYVLPIELTSPNYSLNKTRSRLFLKPVIITPKVSLNKTGKQEEIKLSIRDNNVTTADFTMALMVNMKNMGWKFGVKFQTDEDQLRQLVQEYKMQANDGAAVSLLPKKNYKIPDINFAGTENTKEMTIKIDRSGLPIGNYLLPVMITECVGMPFDISNEVTYIPVKITEEIPKITLSVNNLFANSTDGNSIPNLINGSYTDDGWQSQWYNASINKPISDPKYGVYIDLKNLSIASVARLLLTIKTTHNNPKHIQIYGGSSESNLKLLQENLNCYPNSATNKKYDTGNIDVSGVTMIRIAMLSNVNGTDMRNLQFYSGAYIQNVSMAEIELYGQ